MKTSVYLYGRCKDWGHIPYNKAIEKKIKYANEQLKIVLAVDYRERDHVKMNDLLEAIKFNEFLLTE